MNITSTIALRYLLGKKSTAAINIITWISIVGITIGTASLIIILSVFNGFEEVLSGLYNSFNPDLKVLPRDGKYFEFSNEEMSEIKNINGVNSVSQTLQEVALFEYKDNQKPGLIKGVDDHYLEVTNMDSTIRMGKFLLRQGSVPYGVLGRGLSTNLSVNLNDKLTPVSVHMPKRKPKGMLSRMGKEFSTKFIYPAGTFSVGSEADVQYMITGLSVVQSLLDSKNKISSLEIRISPNADEDKIREALNNLFPEKITIKNRYEQDSTFLKVMNIEKWVGFLIIVLTLIIIAFNMVGSLWMMVLEKKKDISILRSMGLNTQGVRKIFFMEGMMITVAGIVLGILLALVLYILQKKYDLITIPDGFMINAYPIELRFSDFLIVIFTVLIIGALASLLPSYRAGKVSAFVRREL